MSTKITVYTNNTKEFFETICKGISPEDPDKREEAGEGWMKEIVGMSDISDNVSAVDAPFNANLQKVIPWCFKRVGDDNEHTYRFSTKVEVEYNVWSTFWERYCTAIYAMAKQKPSDVDGDLDVIGVNVVDYRDVAPGIGIIDLVILTKDQTACTEAEPV